MAANRPVSDDELDQLPGRISNHFDGVRDLLADEADDSDVEKAPEDLQSTLSDKQQVVSSTTLP